jgi:hypothetical protein
MRKRSIAGGAFVIAAIGAVMPPFANAPPDLAKLVGARANGAESAIGYQPTGKGDGIFFNAITGTSVQIQLISDENGGNQKVGLRLYG